MKYDFVGWATRNNLKCADGRTIRENAFADQDGQIVPLVWNHQHDNPYNVLGHVLLKNEKEGVRCYGSFNDTPEAERAKEALAHHDIDGLSIYANNLTQTPSRDVLHGVIREVSLVLAGANPGAYIDTMSFAHSADGIDDADEAIITSGEELTLSHSDNLEKEKKMDGEDEKKQSQQEPETKSDDNETIQDVLNTLNEKQKTVVYALIGETIKNAKEIGNDDSGNEEGEGKMKHNVFDNDQQDDREYISHADQGEILGLAKNTSVGTFKNALDIYAQDHGMDLQHDAVTASGFAADNIDYLFPEYKDVRPGAPELITNDQGWISTVMAKVHKSPISRIRTGQVDIRKIEDLRAKGYVKGKEKKYTGNFKLVRRTTDPQTVYVKNALNRDDITDITDFDYVAYLYNIDKMMLNEELATAIMLGDGRDEGDADKIFPEHIRPIWTDDDLYTIHQDLDLAAIKKELSGTQTFGDNYTRAEALINTMLYAREKYKGTGTPDMYITPHELNVMLLARDLNGRRIYSSKNELAQALNVNSIITCEQFEGKTRKTNDGKTKKLLCLVCNLADYSLGSTKGGEITHFTDFDIDFNQEKSLIETRVSGALTRVYSALAIEEDVTSTSTSSTEAAG